MSCAFVGIYTFLAFSYIWIRLLHFLNKQKGRRASHGFSNSYPFGFFHAFFFYYHPFMTNSAVIFLAKNNFKCSPHPWEEIPSSGWHTEPPARELLMPSTVPSTNSSNSEKVALCLISVWLAPYSFHWLKWWLHPLNSPFKPGFHFSAHSFPCSNSWDWINPLRSAVLK